MCVQTREKCFVGLTAFFERVKALGVYEQATDQDNARAGAWPIRLIRLHPEVGAHLVGCCQIGRSTNSSSSQAHCFQGLERQET